MKKNGRKGARALLANQRLRLRRGDRILLVRATEEGLRAYPGIDSAVAVPGDYEVQIVVVDASADGDALRWN